MTSTRRLLTGLLVVVLVGALVATAVGSYLAGTTDGSGGRPAAGEPTIEPGSQDPDDPALADLYRQEIDWAPCPDQAGFECGRLTVPLDYADPTGETIELALLKNPADEPTQRRGHLVVNPGGPGAPGTSYAAADRNVFGQPVLDSFDVVGFDPRGTGDSHPIDCLPDEALSAHLELDPSPDTEQEERAFLRSSEEFFAGCVERSGELAAHVSTVEVARDVDVLRAALGEAELDYLGASYGTKLGAYYAELFPDRVGRMVLDGGLDPTLDPVELSLGQAGGFERALLAYVGNCVDETEDCFLGDSVEEGVAQVADLLAEIDAEPLPAGNGRELTLGNAFYGIALPLYDRQYWVLLSAALRAALDGDGQPLLQLADLYFARDAEGNYADNSAEAILAINCLDDPGISTEAAVRRAMPAFERASPTFGEALAWGLMGCHGVQVDAAEEPPTVDGAGAAPIVVVGTTRDPATPYEWSVALAEQLESAVLVSREGDGHTGYQAGNPCVDQAVEEYLIGGEVPDDGLEC